MPSAEHVRHTVRAWIDANRDDWTGLRAAHLVGSASSLTGDAPFPASKDVDVHLIFADDAPILASRDPWDGPLEVEFGGLMIEAGCRPLAEYASPEVVLGNPEIAYHLTVDSVLTDPFGLLAGLMPAVQRDYARRVWVEARLAHERRGFAGVQRLAPMIGAQFGAAGEATFLGYLITFPIPALLVAELESPRGGIQMLRHLRTSLARHDRLDLYPEALAIFGVTEVSPAEVTDWLAATLAVFDQAVACRAADPTINGPFQHKLHAHLRPYLQGSTADLVAAGFHREALVGALPYLLTSTSIVSEHGVPPASAAASALEARCLAGCNLDTIERRATAFGRMSVLAGSLFDLADQIAASHPGIVDEPAPRG